MTLPNYKVAGIFDSVQLLCICCYFRLTCGVVQVLMEPCCFKYLKRFFLSLTEYQLYVSHTCTAAWEYLLTVN